MSGVLLGWVIIGFLAAVVSVVPPLLHPSREMGFWDRFREFNLYLWGFILGVGTLSGLLVWAMYLIGVVRW